MSDTGPFHNIEERAEDALAACLADWLEEDMGEEPAAGWPIVKGFASAEPPLPGVSVVTTEADPEILGAQPTGNWYCTVETTVRSRLAPDPDAEVEDPPALDMRAQHMEAVAYIRDRMLVIDLAKEINEAGHEVIITVHKAEMLANTRTIEGEDGLVAATTIPLRLYCCPIDPAPEDEE